MGLEFHAGNGTVCMIGEENEKKHLIRENVHAIDYGIDFYAPQTLKALDGRRVMIAWLQNWDTARSHPITDRICGQMTLPRELSIRDGRLIQQPVREIENYYGEKISYKNVPLSTETFLTGIRGRTIDMTVNVRPANPRTASTSPRSASSPTRASCAWTGPDAATGLTSCMCGSSRSIPGTAASGCGWSWTGTAWSCSSTTASRPPAS